MDKLKSTLTLALIALTSGIVFSEEVSIERTNEARNSLKDYGLVSCLIAIEPSSVLATDLGYIKRSLSFMGKGSYSIVQDEDTFEIKHDPYSETVVFMLKEAKKSVGYMKSGETSKSIGCFKVYHSIAFDAFITEQDAYIMVNR